MLVQHVIDAYRKHYRADPALVVCAPGRVNLIGDHTDYNDGFVLPMAIDRAVCIAISARDDGHVQVTSLDFDEPISFDIDGFSHLGASPGEYMKGVAWALQEAGYELTGWQGVMKGNVPIGAGLSSSAALELATARTFSAVSGFRWDAQQMALLSQKAENEWVGMNCGIMDQLISATGQAGHAVLIDCRTLERTPAPLPPDTVVMVLDTNTRRGLVDSKYNERREQCERAAEFFGVPKLRDVSLEDFNARAHDLDELTRKRARHVITENSRTVEAQRAMSTGDAGHVGHLMNESHISLRDDFEVSTDALNAIVEAAQEHPACYGARMTGAGFGGCACALIHTDALEAFTEHVQGVYQERTGNTASIYACYPSAGAAVAEVN